MYVCVHHANKPWYRILSITWMLPLCLLQCIMHVVYSLHFYPFSISAIWLWVHVGQRVWMYIGKNYYIVQQNDTLSHYKMHLVKRKYKIEGNTNCLHVCFCMMPVMLKSPRLIWINQRHKGQSSNNVFYQFVRRKWSVSTIMSYNKELYCKKGKRIMKLETKKLA